MWESVEHLKDYVYKSAHGEVMRRRRQWFEKFEGMYMALWWVKAGHVPTVAEAKQRLAYLQQHGETMFAFTFKRLFPPANAENESLIGLPSSPCPAA